MTWGLFPAPSQTVLRRTALPVLTSPLCVATFPAVRRRR
jgi:hypothetical protein